MTRRQGAVDSTQKTINLVESASIMHILLDIFFFFFSWRGVVLFSGQIVFFPLSVRFFVFRNIGFTLLRFFLFSPENRNDKQSLFKQSNEIIKFNFGENL